MPKVICKRQIKGCKEQAFLLASKMEDYPNYMENVISVKLVDKGPDWTITEWETKVEGRTMKWTERDEFDYDNHVIKYKQLQGDLKQFEGEWRFCSEGQAAVIELEVNFDLGIPMLSGMLHPILSKKVEANGYAMLDAIGEQVG